MCIFSLDVALYPQTPHIHHARSDVSLFFNRLLRPCSRLNATRNTTQCKTASFFLFSLRLLPTNLPYTSRYTWRMRFSGFAHARGAEDSFVLLFKVMCQFKTNTKVEVYYSYKFLMLVANVQMIQSVHP